MVSLVDKIRQTKGKGLPFQMLRQRFTLMHARSLVDELGGVTFDWEPIITIWGSLIEYSKFNSSSTAANKFLLLTRWQNKLSFTNTPRLTCGERYFDVLSLIDVDEKVIAVELIERFNLNSNIEQEVE